MVKVSNKSMCRLVTNLCKIADQFKGTCLSCYDNYFLENGGCARKNIILPNCKQIN